MSDPTRTTLRISPARFLGLMGERRRAYLASLILFAIVQASERVYIGWVVKLFVNAIVAVDQAALWRSLILWVGFMALWIPSTVGAYYLWRGTTVRALADLRERLFAHIQRLPLAYHEGRHSGDVVSVLTNDLTVASAAYQEHLMDLAHTVVVGLSTGVAMFIFNWRLALVVLAAGMLPVIINAARAPRLRRIGEDVQARVGTVGERLSDLLAGAPVVRSYGLGEWALGRFGLANRGLLCAALGRVRLEASLEGVGGLGFLAMMATPFSVGALMVMRGQATFGDIIANLQLSGPVMNMVTSFSGLLSRLQGSLAAIERVVDVLETPAEPERYPAPAATQPIPQADPRYLLQLESVHFSYAGDEDVIRGLDLGVEPGARVAIVGPSGGGKSTVFKLLLGCYPPGEGALYVQGRPLSDWTLEDLRAQFAYIPQDAYLYSGTVRENIRYGRPEATDTEIEEAARAAHADGFIRELPAGYNTMVGERGARLSGGQRQRIAIARALLRDAPILLLDEATSALDSQSEAQVQAALERLMEGRTTLAIAHRLSTVEHADQVIVIAEGRVAEQGTQPELLALGGVFRRLYDLQFADEGNSA